MCSSDLGFWAAVRDVWPATRAQRDWCHKLANVVDQLPQGLQPKAKRALREMMYAATRTEAEELIDRFAAVYEPKYPKVAECLVSDREALLTHVDVPAEHWLHIRTTNPGVSLRHGAAAPAGHEGSGQPDEGSHDGLQAARDGRAALAPGKWGAPAAAGACRRAVR